MNKTLGIQSTGSAEVQSHASVSQGNPTTANTFTQVPQRKVHMPLTMPNYTTQIPAQGASWPNGENSGLTPSQPRGNKTDTWGQTRSDQHRSMSSANI